MTLEELSQLYHLSREIADIKRRICEIEQRAQPHAAAYTGMPKSARTPDVTGEIAAELADVKRILADTLRERHAERVKVEWYIRSVEDSYIRRVMRYRYIDGLTWQAVAFRMGGYNTASGCRMAVKRYVSRRERKEGRA